MVPENKEKYLLLLITHKICKYFFKKFLRFPRLIKFNKLDSLRSK